MLFCNGILFCRFTVNRRISVVGFGLYGSIHGPTDYQVNIQVLPHPCYEDFSSAPYCPAFLFVLKGSHYLAPAIK